MMTRSNRYLGECDYVTLPIPQVDRSVSSAPNLICRIVDIDYIHNMHELACETDFLNIMFARNCFERLKSKDLPNVHINCEKAISVREAASKIDIGGGQGMLKCYCIKECQKKSTCKKNNLLCNSRCHHNNTKCLNK